MGVRTADHKQGDAKPGFNRSPIATAKLALAMLCSGAGAAAAQTVHGTSPDGEWRIEISQMPAPAPLNQMISPLLRLTSREGPPPKNTGITLTGLRTYTRNTLPTAPQIVPLPVPGQYRIEGLRFHIAGPWQLTFTIKSETNSAQITIPIEVK